MDTLVKTISKFILVYSLVKEKKLLMPVILIIVTMPSMGYSVEYQCDGQTDTYLV